MFRWFKPKMPETRAGEIDLGSLYASVFFGGSGAYSRSPAILVSSLAIPGYSGALLTEARRLGRTSPLLIAYRSVVETGVLSGSPEAPTFGDIVPNSIAAAVADMWIGHHDLDLQRERDLLDRLILDGEFLELDGGEIIPPDGFEPMMAGPKWNRVVIGYKVGQSSRPRMAGLRYVGDRPMGASQGACRGSHRRCRLRLDC